MYARCPICHEDFHLAVRSFPADWEREHVKERAADGRPLLKCIRCWASLRPGHKVTVRLVPETHVNDLHMGQEGIVESLPSSPEGEITVRFGSFRACLQREALSYVVGQPAVP